MVILKNLLMKMMTQVRKMSKQLIQIFTNYLLQNLYKLQKKVKKKVLEFPNSKRGHLKKILRLRKMLMLLVPKVYLMNTGQNGKKFESPGNEQQLTTKNVTLKV